MFRRLLTGLTLGSLSLLAPVSTGGVLRTMAAHAAPATPSLPRLGDRGDTVVKLQKALLDKGIRVAGGADGVFGRATQSAIRSFQESIGLPTTGDVDAITGHLLGLAPAPALPVVGQRGDAVRTLQQALIDSGISVRGGADGIFGNATTAAVKTFQGKQDLPVTGVVDVMTAIRLRVLPAAATNPTATPTPAETPAASVGASSNPSLPAIGERGPKVAVLQKALIAAGVNVRGGADGIFGNATASALRTYQETVGLTANGRVDEPTAQLLGLIPPPELPRRGDSSGQVQAAQKRLIELGFRITGGADGDFGSATSRAVSAFQRERGFEETGKFDLRTYVVLMAGPTPSSPSTPPTSDSPAPADDGPAAKVEIFPAQGPCWFTDSWHAPRSGGRVHLGVDIIAPTGKAVYAVADGTITRVFFDRPGSLGGNAVRLTTTDGTYFHYAHFSKFGDGIEVGTKVKVGQIIGYIGSTGSSSTPHLHFEYHPKGGAAVNPYPIVKAINGCQNTEIWTPPQNAASGTD